MRRDFPTAGGAWRAYASGPRELWHSSKVPLPIAIFIIALIWPDSAAFNFVGLHLPIYRIYLLLLLPWAVFEIARNRIQLKTPDYFIISFATLQAVALAIHYGLFSTFTYVTSPGLFSSTNTFASTNTIVNFSTVFIESLGPYLAARAFIKTPGDISATARLLIFVIIALGTTTLVEAIMGYSIFGTPTNLLRYGLYRARGPFPHPILWGLFAASTFAFVVAKGVVGTSVLWRSVVMVLLSVAVITSVSSAAYAAIYIQIFIILWFYFSEPLKNRGVYFAIGCMAAYTVVNLLSNRTPAEVILGYAALDPGTAYNRILIWQFGWENFLNSPWIGIGFNNWIRPRWMGGSVDAFWLVMLLRYGLLATVPLVLAVVTSMQQVVRALPRQYVRGNLNLAYFWIASLGSLIISGFTVHYWLQNFVELFLLIGMWGAFMPPTACDFNRPFRC